MTTYNAVVGQLSKEIAGHSLTICSFRKALCILDTWHCNHNHVMTGLGLAGATKGHHCKIQGVGPRAHLNARRRFEARFKTMTFPISPQLDFHQK